MLDHLGIKVSNYAKAKAFFLHVFEPLGYRLVMEFEQYKAAGFGAQGKPDFWIGEGQPTEGAHIAFVAKNRAAVDAFYAAAIEAGAKDNGPPGLRPDYHPGYYGAFVLDADGHNLEAVCHRPE